ncbi:alpha/beta hydrolase [Paenibacillus sp. FSL F4-0125]|uniref:alpha/beta fold hydrolase n=1 Tax=Paenibacillus sp. FSL F4-0125 TaxID=2954730 RepID=UPI0030F7C012
MPYFTYDHIRFYYEDDEGDGEPFIFLHGLGGDVNQTFGVMKQSSHIRRISLDFRGHGKTVSFGHAEDFSFKQFAEDVIALTKHLHLKSFNIGGISTGAGVSLHLALRYTSSVNKLIVSRPAWEDKPQEKWVREAFAKIHDELQGTDPLTAQKRYENSEVYTSINSVSSYAGESLLGQFKYPYVKETSMKFVKLPQDCPNDDREAWKNLKMPTLILASQHDPIHPYAYGRLLSDYIPNNHFIEITSKTINSKQHNHDSYKAIENFLNER